ncbi:globin domain-containing protein [Shimia ponticola]|uniref:globin domain-containing protein n=1 Tax=Shimia ponticola TaxID=2582893 RepID=UPI0011BE8A8E|nr:globin domain-containing protein [Shimia ponticola]
MTPEQVKQISLSFGRVFPFRRHLVKTFYAELFRQAPKTRALFPEDMSGQFDKLADMLHLIVTQLGTSETFLSEVQALGTRHAHYGAKPEHFEAVGHALLHSLKEVVPGGLTAAEEEAWGAAYATLSDVMIKAGRHSSSAA